MHCIACRNPREFEKLSICLVRGHGGVCPRGTLVERRGRHADLPRPPVQLPHCDGHLATLPRQQGVHRLRHVSNDPPLLAGHHLDGDIKGGRSLPLQDRLLHAAPLGLFVSQGHRGDAAHEVGKGGVLEDVLKHLAVAGPHQLHPPLSDGARGQSLELRPNLVDHDHLGHVVLHGLDHDLVLQLRRRDLHPSRAPHSRVRNIPIPPDLIGRVDDHHPLAILVRKHPRDLADCRRLTHPRRAQEKQRLARLDEVPSHGRAPPHAPPHAHGEPHDLSLPVAHAADAV
mmetsp:Transcript_13737/g.43447  ORF Transcript_13737/g.43447 Transcript_13737/m.43447 type:complete len:285 (-) Transcript_13737:654-1508(-)